MHHPRVAKHCVSCKLPLSIITLDKLPLHTSPHLLLLPSYPFVLLIHTKDKESTAAVEVVPTVAMTNIGMSPFASSSCRIN